MSQKSKKISHTKLKQIFDKIKKSSDGSSLGKAKAINNFTHSYFLSDETKN